MDDIQSTLVETFTEEAFELLADLEAALLELETAPDDRELIDRVFRAMHTIKGNAAMFGFERIEAFTHDIETTFDLVRAGKLGITKELVDLTLAARDVILVMLQRPDGDDDPADEMERILSGFRGLVSGHLADAAGEGNRTSPGHENMTATASNRKTYRIRFKPDHDILATGTNPAGLIDELKELGTCTIVTNMESLPDLDSIDPENCYLRWDVILTTDKGLEAVRDVFIFVEGRCDLNIEIIDDEGVFETESDYKKLGEILVDRGDMTSEELEAILLDHKKVGQELVESGFVNGGTVESALVEQELVRDARKKRHLEQAVASIRVSSDKLDGLMNLVGELVTVQARLTRTAEEIDHPGLTIIAEEVEQLTWSLRDDAFAIRMVPIGTMFNRIKRVVRELSGEMGKEISLVMEGSETELDKTVIEKLADPLMHLIRNSMDHGIERPGERVAAGKDRSGELKLSASQEGPEVVIRITDDGRGLDRESIREKAAQKGLLDDRTDVTTSELYQLIFTPGFSTAKKVTSVSGRGVGLDVVKRAMESLRGSVVVDSLEGAGTIVTIRLPLTLAIIDGLQVVIGDERFVIPLSAVEECEELTRLGGNGSGMNIINVRGEAVPYIRLKGWFYQDHAPVHLEQVVIVNVDGDRIGLVVDNVVGEHQTVIKPLGRIYQGVEGVSGATILGDGSVALILDVAEIYRRVKTMEETTDGNGNGKDRETWQPEIRLDRVTKPTETEETITG